MLSTLDRALALRGAPLFAKLSAESLMPVATLCTEVRLAPGDVLFEEGAIGDAMYVVVEGDVCVVAGGRVIKLLGRGECVGEMAALDWESRSATVRADGPALLIRLGRNELLDLLHDHPELVRGLAGVLAARIRAS
jgi:CRP/FNR family transcriptional regulator, cyclic AMP receptor protein